MKKLKFVFLILVALVCTGCSGFWDWVEEENDRTYIYSYSIGEMTSEEYENLFENRWGTSQLDYRGFYVKEDHSDFYNKVKNIMNKEKDGSIAARWSSIEDKLRVDYNYNSSTCSNIYYRLRDEKEILWLDENNYRYVYINLVNVR